MRFLLRFNDLADAYRKTKSNVNSVWFVYLCRWLRISQEFTQTGVDALRAAFSCLSYQHLKPSIKTCCRACSACSALAELGFCFALCWVDGCWKSRKINSVISRTFSLCSYKLLRLNAKSWSSIGMGISWPLLSLRCCITVWSELTFAATSQRFAVARSRFLLIVFERDMTGFEGARRLCARYLKNIRAT